MLRDVAELEILQAPGLPSIIPREYADLPHLTGKTLPPQALSWLSCLCEPAAHALGARLCWGPPLYLAKTVCMGKTVGMCM